MVDPRRPGSVLDLAGSEYVLLTTFTRDGRPKPTPVWAAPDGDALVVLSEGGSWKVRRVRGTPRVTLAACDARGRPTGEPVDGVAVAVTQPALLQRMLAALGRKYTWKITLLTLYRAVLRREGGEGLVIRDLQAAPRPD